MPPEIRPLNDNKGSDPRDRLIADVLVQSVVVEEHLTSGLQKMLAESGVGKRVRDAVGEFVQPLIDHVNSKEGTLIDAARAIPDAEGLTELFDAVLARMESFGDEFARHAHTPEAAKVAASFKEFVSNVVEAWSLPPLAVEIETPDLGVREITPPKPANDRGRELER
jgi:hypothetical protein